MIKNKKDISDALEEIQELGDNWHYEHIPGPNANAIRDVFRVLEQLYDVYGVLPQRVTQTVEEGVYVDFINGHRVILEIYNKGGAAIVVTDYKEIIGSIDVKDEDRVNIICGLMPKILKN